MVILTHLSNFLKKCPAGEPGTKHFPAGIPQMFIYKTSIDAGYGGIDVLGSMLVSVDQHEINLA